MRAYVLLAVVIRPTTVDPFEAGPVGRGVWGGHYWPFVLSTVPNIGNDQN